MEGGQEWHRADDVEQLEQAKEQDEWEDSEGSDFEFVDMDAGSAEAVSVVVAFSDYNAQILKALRRSPKKHLRTLVTDFLSGLKKRDDLTVRRTFFFQHMRYWTQ